MPVSRSSYASCTVIMFRAALEPQQPSILYEANAQVGSLFSVSDPKPLDKLTILPAFAFRINGNMALVTARVSKKLTSKTRRTALRSVLLGGPSSPSTTPALFPRTSSRPHREAIHSAAA